MDVRVGALGTVPLVGCALATSLAVLSILAWWVVAGAVIPMAGVLDPVALFFFVLIWSVGMVAMMFPSLVPIAYAVTVSAEKLLEADMLSRSRRLTAIWRMTVFVLGYVGMWAFVGVLFYLGFAVLVAAGLPLGLGFNGWLAGTILVATGLYQFSRFKRNALMKCRSPLGFIATRWRQGSLGAILMGLDYGGFCSKCCWVLMLGLLTIGAMSLPLMGLFALIIFAEKVGPFAAAVPKILGVSFLLAGLYFFI